MNVLLNYASPDWAWRQKLNSLTGKWIAGFDRVIEAGTDCIDPVFAAAHAHIFSHKRGNGYWLWKPYLIHKHLAELKEGDVLFYCDSGSFFTRSIKQLTTTLEQSGQDILFFDLPFVERQFTKGDTFALLECNETEMLNSNQRLATFILIRKSARSVDFIREYLAACCDPRLLTDAVSTAANATDYLDHRHDQSILSVLSKKYGFDSFRDPSQYGRHPLSYRRPSTKLQVVHHQNSPYRTTLILYRNCNPIITLIKTWVKDALMIVQPKRNSFKI
jgi:hypothetical protein